MLCVLCVFLVTLPSERVPLQPLDVVQSRTPKLVKQAKAAMRSTVSDLRKAKRLGSQGVDETLAKQVQVLRALRRQFPAKDRGVRHHVPENATEIKASLDRMTQDQKDKMGKLAVGFAQASAKKALQKLRATERKRSGDWPNLSGPAVTVKSTKRKQSELFFELQRRNKDLHVMSAEATRATQRLVEARRSSAVALLAERKVVGGANRAREAARQAKQKAADSTQKSAATVQAEATAARAKERAEADARRAEADRRKFQRLTSRAENEAQITTRHAGKAKKDAQNAKAVADKAGKAAAAAAAEASAAAEVAGQVLGHNTERRIVRRAQQRRTAERRASTKPGYRSSRRPH
jgi:hypothetical protein